MDIEIITSMVMRIAIDHGLIIMAAVVIGVFAIIGMFLQFTDKSVMDEHDYYEIRKKAIDSHQSQNNQTRNKKIAIIKVTTLFYKQTSLN